MPTKCYYEVLGVERDANEDELKKAYRRQALIWHPDKNPDRIAEATEQFRLVQQAYDVLIDPQERSWYDDHREAIIRGGFKHRGADGTTDEDDSLDVYEYFTTSCFSGFGDDEKGFFGVYKKVFKTIADEDFPYLEERISYPDFGSSTSTYDEVVGKFYDFWESYTTAKSYCWADKWDTREAPNRDYRRAMDLDNKKFRDKAKKERNDEVRALVRFVKKRDPRIAARRKEIEERNTAIAKKQAEQRRQEAQARREMRAAVAREMAEGATDWTHTDDDQLRDLEEKLASEFGRHSISDHLEEQTAGDEVEEDPLYCVACDKSFRTDKALINHVKSRKHVERVDFVRSQLGDIGDDDDDEMAAKILARLESLEAMATQTEGADDDDVNSAKKTNKQSKTKKGKPREATDEEGDGKVADVNDNLQTSTIQPESAEDQPQKKPKIKTRPVKCETPEPQDVIYKCDKCKEVFPSRNKMFQHLAESGHALPPKQIASQATEVGSKSAKKTKTKGK